MYINLDDVHTLTLSLDTNAYADADVLAETQEIEEVFKGPAATAILNSIVLLDKDDQAGALDLVFFRSNVSLGTENAAVAISDANADEIIAVVQFVAGDYIDLANSQIAIKGPGDLGQLLKPSGDDSLYVGAISRDAKTYTAAGITLKIGLLKS
jgi:hypothetical protein